jgi:CHAT domain-containing protein
MAAQRLDRLRATDGPTSELEKAGQELNALSVINRELDAQIRTESPRYASLVQPQPLSLREVQAEIVDEDSVLLQYFLGAELSYVWTVTTDRINVYALPPRERIEALIHQLRRLMGDSSGVDPHIRSARSKRHETELAERVSEILLGPASNDLGERRLLIVPDGILHFVAFAALPVPGGHHAAGRATVPLISKHEVVHLPSASTLALIRREWKREKHWSKKAIVFADPVFEIDDPRITTPAIARSRLAARSRPAPSTSPALLQRALRDLGGLSQGVPRLLGSRREAETIASIDPAISVALGFAASRTAATNINLADYGIVHFATHGIIDNDHPELSGIILSLVNEKGESQDGFLRLHDIYNLRLPVDLVVLSACSTAIGKEVHGEGLIGLVRGFMYAGSRRVLATLWKVDDEATSALMKHFYAGMFVRRLSPAAALRHAQLELMKVERWRDPFYWAAFVLQGDTD